MNVAIYDLKTRGFIHFDNGSKGSRTHAITQSGIAYIELHNARKRIDKSMQRILRESRENYSDYVKECIEWAKKWRSMTDEEKQAHINKDLGKNN